MTVLLVLIFAAIALVAIGFAASPVLIGSRGPGADAPHSISARETRAGKGRLVLVGAIALLMLGVGGGTYLMVGEPQLAMRTLEGTDTKSLNGLIGLLIARVREVPHSDVGWTLLGRSYLTAGDPGDAAKAFQRALALKPSAELYSAYGEALVEQSGGTVDDEAEAAFRAALGADPKDGAARYYLGIADATKGRTEEARALWQSLLADLPASSPIHGVLVDRLAALAGQTGAAPDISTMVASLAARLKAEPNDPAGWQRLVRAYAVLGDRPKAETALADARHALAKQPAALTALDGEAKELKLD